MQNVSKQMNDIIWNKWRRYYRVCRCGRINFKNHITKKVQNNGQNSVVPREWTWHGNSMPAYQIHASTSSSRHVCICNNTCRIHIRVSSLNLILQLYNIINCKGYRNFNIFPIFCVYTHYTRNWIVEEMLCNFCDENISICCFWTDWKCCHGCLVFTHFTVHRQPIFVLRLTIWKVGLKLNDGERLSSTRKKKMCFVCIERSKKKPNNVT